MLYKQNKPGSSRIFSAIDQLFVLKSLADLYLSKRKSAVSSMIIFFINRSTLWSKILASGISGKIFDVIKTCMKI